MKLTGKAALEFLSWYVQNVDTKVLSHVQFRHMPDNVQWGVYVDFFDSKEVKISVCWIEDSFWSEVQISQPSPFSDWVAKYEEEFKSLAEARKAAIEKANEIYNAR